MTLERNCRTKSRGVFVNKMKRQIDINLPNLLMEVFLINSNIKIQFNFPEAYILPVCMLLSSVYGGGC